MGRSSERGTEAVPLDSEALLSNEDSFPPIGGIYETRSKSE